MASKFLKIRSKAKVNLCIDILGRDASGYHEIQTVYQEVPHLYDEIEIAVTNTPEISVSSNRQEVPVDETNTALKAARLLQKHFQISHGAKIFIRKNIPLFSGFGGGSSNAVVVLKGLAELWDLSAAFHPPASAFGALPVFPAPSTLFTSIHEILMNLAQQIGMDCPFFFYGGTALGTHFGEKITPIPSLLLDTSLTFGIHEIDTGVKISSREAYEWVDLSRCGKEVKKTEKLIEGLREQNPQKILENLHNDFELFIFEKHPELLRYKMLPNIHLTGCGGALFAASIESPG